MQFMLKLVITVAIVIISAQIGKRFPSLAGLIATMPLTGLIVLMWLYSDNPGNMGIMVEYTRGALWGIVPSILFYLAVLICFRRGLNLTGALGVGFGVWMIGAMIHQTFLR